MSDGPRFTQVPVEQFNDAQKRVAERVLKVSSAGLGGPYAILLRSPILLERYLGMTDYFRFETSLPKHLNEFAILIEARLWDAQYEWWAHHPIALRAGLSPELAEDVRNGRRPEPDGESYQLDPFIGSYVFPDGELSPIGTTVSVLEQAVAPVHRAAERSLSR